MVEKRGGFQPNAPQNNPANVNGLGGNGTSGEYTGFAYGMNKQLNESMSAGNQALSGLNTPSAQSDQSAMPPVPTILDETNQKDVPIQDGARIGPGLNYIPNLPTNPSNDPDIDYIQDQVPLIQVWASMPGTTRATAQYATYLTQIMPGIISGEQQIS